MVWYSVNGGFFEIVCFDWWTGEVWFTPDQLTVWLVGSDLDNMHMFK